MTNRFFQNQLNQFRERTTRFVGVADENGRTVATTDPSGSERRFDGFEALSAGSGSSGFISDGCTFMPLPGQPAQYFVYSEGTDETAKTAASILSVALGSARKLYDDKYDRSSFIRGVIFDNMLPDEIRQRERDLHFSPDDLRAVFVIRLPEEGDPAHAEEILLNLFPDRQRDFVFRSGRRDALLCKLLKRDQDRDQRREIAAGITGTFGTELFSSVTVGVSRVACGASGLPAAYREAMTSLEICDIFGERSGTVFFDSLGLSRLIYMMPASLCREYLDEIFTGGSIDSLDPEILQTVQCFFENSLNVSETSRKLFIHRNTLVYRLEKIRKLTGLDLRDFDSAIGFRVGLMIKRYLEYRQNDR